ncbi:hypothetical protein Nepgr_033238 [Nepenthes gracilis]|uniref:VQ domain-containing protein n=1 Tax=Nepenthes gracilis TaxID=150966 RepID=A0AAD3Y883_NEPGR|nr:hypothetical protein Nepgr_033238 [Nepenthes gracilis]
MHRNLRTVLATTVTTTTFSFCFLGQFCFPFPVLHFFHHFLMNSGNSSSMQSSSGGDEEYESRADSIPDVDFFNQISSQPPPQLVRPHQLNHPLSLFDPPPNFNLHPNLFASIEDRSGIRSLIWPVPASDAGAIRSDPNCATSTVVTSLGQLASSSSSIVAHLQSSAQGNEAQAAQPPAVAAESNIQSRPKKRTRASRRAPTTVLTTDTTNFRAMVQEFTGIPAPPFSSAASSPYSRRFDLLRTGGRGSSLRTGSAQMMHKSSYSPSLLSTAMVENHACSDINPSNFNSSANPMEFSEIPQHFDSNMGSSIFTFQSLLSSPFSPLKYLSTANAPTTFGLQSDHEESLGATSSSLQRVEVSQEFPVMNQNIGGFPTARLTSDDGNQGGDQLRSDKGNNGTCGASSSSNFHQKAGDGECNY